MTITTTETPTTAAQVADELERLSKATLDAYNAKSGPGVLAELYEAEVAAWDRLRQRDEREDRLPAFYYETDPSVLRRLLIQAMGEARMEAWRLAREYHREASRRPA